MHVIPPHILLGAYAQGIFPMAHEGEIRWFEPTMRGLIPLDDRFHISNSLKRTIAKKIYQIKYNTAFTEVMLACAERESTWIDQSIIESYTSLYQLGHAMSFESWDHDGLQGGLYGVSLGRAFFGESMFSRKTDTSKVALVGLVDFLRNHNYVLLDTQWLTPHLAQFGGYEVPRKTYLRLLKDALMHA